MDAVATTSLTDDQFTALLKQDPVALDAALDMIDAASKDAMLAKKATAWAIKLVQHFADTGNFDSLYLVVKNYHEAIRNPLGPTGIGNLLLKTCKNRMVKAMLTAAGFGGAQERNLPACFRRFENLRDLRDGAAVIDKAWGFGIVKRVDDFYGRVTIDFNGRPNHALTFATACETLMPAPKEHFWTRWHETPEAILAMRDKNPGDLVCAVLQSFGPMPVQRLEDILEKAKVLSKTGSAEGNGVWKKFWEAARRDLKNNKHVFIPTRRTDNLQYQVKAEDYGEDYFARLAKNRDPEGILAAVAELRENGKFAKPASAADDGAAEAPAPKAAPLTPEQTAVLQNRLSFAIRGAAKIRMPLYARCAVTIDSLGYPEPPLQEMLDSLWADNAYIHAGYKLSVRDTDAMIALLLKGGDEAAARMLEAVNYREANHDPEHPAMCCTMVNAVLDALKDTPSTPEVLSAVATYLETLNEDAPAAAEGADALDRCAALLGVKREELPEGIPAAAITCYALLKLANAPFAVVAWYFRNRKSLGNWKLQVPVIRLMDHGIALIEMSATGESLHAQNYLKQLLDSDAEWKDIMGRLSDQERRLLFERIQASAAMESSFQRKLIGHMLECDDSLKAFKRSPAQREKVQTRFTSLHSMADRQMRYKRLVEVEMPLNRKAIQEAREKGDLSENAEYQYAKDRERELLQQQAALYQEIKRIKETDFADMPTDKVGPGVAVTIALPDSTEETYSILGEWDYDEKLNIISNITRLAKALENARVGDTVTIPRLDGEVPATIKEIAPLSEAVRNWIHTIPAE